MSESRQENNDFVQIGMPPQFQMREKLRRMVRRHVEAKQPTPPLSLADLQRRCCGLLTETGSDREYLSYVTVLMNNEMWRDRLASVPYDRRLLLLPQCLRDADSCPAQPDQLGMICRRCGRCVIGDLLTEAEQLGYATLVAKGTVVVTKLVQSNKIDAIVGVSCLATLEQAFPHIAAAVCPGVAIPLLRDGCVNTALDVAWLREAMCLADTARAEWLDLSELRRQVEAWFRPEALAETLGPVSGQTEQIARQWLARSGKRWRPLLAACAYQALRDEPGTDPPAALAQMAVAIECFHKASLAHDDIEDGDELRYGRRTLHAQYGVPIALNVGDFLVGEGYRLLAEADIDPALKAKMLKVAVDAHRQLCLGQGAELCWTRDGGPLTMQDVIDIYTRKTSPAFEVSLALAAILAGADEGVFRVLAEYSRALGAAYQIRDDLQDAADGDGRPKRPSLLTAILPTEPGPSDGPQDVTETFSAQILRDAANRLLQEYRQRAIDCLESLHNAELKSLLRRAVAKIFNEIEIQEWAFELEAGHAPGGG